VAAVAGIPASGAYLLYYTWQGCSSFTRRSKSEYYGARFVYGDRKGMGRRRRSTRMRAAIARTIRRRRVHWFAFMHGLWSAGREPRPWGFPEHDSLARVINRVTVTIGGIEAEWSLRVALQSDRGVYEIAVRVPEGLERGPQPVVVETVAPPQPPAQRVVVQVR